jgi:REP element-mobilizing transposase RayT
MPRSARQKSATGIYHTMLRGIDKRTIFEIEQDYLKFLSYIEMAREKKEFDVYAYCLMPNHIHLLVKTEEEEIGRFMSHLTVGYAQYFNYRLARTGHLFQNRFKSEVVEDDAYFLTLVRYIHHNPRKAGIVKDSKDYPWSSYPIYLQSTKTKKALKSYSFMNTEFVLGMFTKLSEFVRFMEQPNDDKCMDVDERIRYTVEQLTELISKMVGKKDLTKLDKEKKLEIFKLIKETTRATSQQLYQILKLGH